MSVTVGSSAKTSELDGWLAEVCPGGETGTDPAKRCGLLETSIAAVLAAFYPQVTHQVSDAERSLRD